jgi:hypothetical protein
MARPEWRVALLLLMLLMLQGPAPYAQELPAVAAPMPGAVQETVQDDASEASSEERLELQLRNLVTSWASAWQSQLDDIYLLHYHPLFEPEGFASRDDWEASRRARLVEPGSISIGLREFELLQWGGTTAVVRFRLDYSRPGYADQTWKQLVLALNGELWQILREQNLAVTRVAEP